jgi:2-deoxy-D-gluconate 3-dehydrogenase
MDLGLTDQVAIVTGASRGLGLAITDAFVAEGMRVLAAARTAEDLERLAAAHPGRVVAQPCDMTDLAAVEALPHRAVDAFGRLDVVVNNAGVAPAAVFADAPMEHWQHVFAVNIFAPVALTKAAGEYFIPQRRGKVINIASLVGLRGKATLAAYSGSKGALVRFTEALAAEWARHNVQVNAIAPGAFATVAQQAVLESPTILERRLRKIPAGRMGGIEEIGPLTCYLASPASDFVTGSIYVIDGGELSKL